METESPSNTQQRVRIAVARLLARESGRAPTTAAIHHELAPHGISAEEVADVLDALRADGVLYETPKGWRLRAPPSGPDATQALAGRVRLLRS
jgi:hypothetical protein